MQVVFKILHYALLVVCVSVQGLLAFIGEPMADAIVQKRWRNRIG